MTPACCTCETVLQTSVCVVPVTAGCDPTIMGIGPVAAIQAMLSATGQTIQDIDLVEVSPVI